MLPRLAIPVLFVLLLSIVFVPHVYAQQTLENPQPGSFQSGVGVISGWACEAQTIEVSFDGGPRLQAGAGTIGQTPTECVGTRTTVLDCCTTGTCLAMAPACGRPGHPPPHVLSKAGQACGKMEDVGRPPQSY